MQPVNRRIGGLEKMAGLFDCIVRVNRRIGGLEITPYFLCVYDIS